MAKCQRTLFPLTSYERLRAVRVTTGQITFFCPTTKSMRVTPTLINNGGLLVYDFETNTPQDGFTIAVAGVASPGGVTLHAVKSNHGLKDAYLVFASGTDAPKAFLSAEQ